MLYLIKSGEYVKIGYTNDLQNRINIYKTHNPIIEMIDVIEGTRIDELYLHQLCEKYLYYGEWFADVGAVTKIWNGFKEETGKISETLTLDKPEEISNDEKDIEHLQKACWKIKKQKEKLEKQLKQITEKYNEVSKSLNKSLSLAQQTCAVAKSYAQECKELKEQNAQLKEALLQKQL